ncbi:XRE family transcriptional regulator [Streptomyces sp. ACT015]|uniref:XRE family transcriptional regulator n=1 Tax=Streptomyces sp. ACT015 TaxID=3134807 RepID=UPI003D1651CC
MPRPSVTPNQSPERSSPPFNALAARRLRAALGMRPENVAYGLRASYGMPHVTADLVAAWERGTTRPSGRELTALAGVLWCAPEELVGRAQVLRDHRVARGLAPEDVARALGIDLPVYLDMEEHSTWRGTERQAAVLTELLDLALPVLLTVTGRAGKLAELLREAVTTRWQASVRPVGKMLTSLDRRLLEVTLQELHQEYREHEERTAAAPQRGDYGREFLDRILDHFWSAIESRTGRAR